MPRKSSISTQQACIIAIGALDDLVTDLVKASGLGMSPGFFDWVADEATPWVERRVTGLFDNERFAQSLKMGDPRVALARWVRHWVGPWIVARFEPLAVYLPEFSASGQGALN